MANAHRMDQPLRSSDYLQTDNEPEPADERDAEESGGEMIVFWSPRPASVR